MSSADKSDNRTNNANTDLGCHLDRSLVELHHLVEVYHQHGHADEAKEIYRTITRMRENQQNNS